MVSNDLLENAGSTDNFGGVAYGAVDRAIDGVSIHGAVACAIDYGSNRADDCISNGAVDNPCGRV